MSAPSELTSGDLLSTLDPRLLWEDTHHPTSGKHIPKSPSLDEYDSNQEPEAGIQVTEIA